jgi:hypothetical protein
VLTRARLVLAAKPILPRLRGSAGERDAPGHDAMMETGKPRRSPGGLVMRRAWLVVVAACGSAAPRPIDNVVPTPAYSCDSAATALARNVLPATRARATTALAAACSEDAWPELYVRCVSTGATDCRDERPAAHKQRQDVILAIAELPSCFDYETAITAMGRCKAVPRATADAMRQAHDMLMQNLPDPSVPADTRMAILGALDSACRQAAYAVQQTNESAGC